MMLLRILKIVLFLPDALQVVQTTLSTNSTADVVKDEKSSVSRDALQVVQATLLKDTATETHQIDILQSETQKDPELHVDQSQDESEIPVMEKQDCLEEGRVGMDVDEPVAGPSGVPEAGLSAAGSPVAGPSGIPVEWQGATVEELEDIRLDLETEQKSLALEHGRQNRIAATVSNEMYTECQELLELFGVPYLVSPMEAEAQCAALDVLDLTHGSITDDSDIFLFGGRRVYKNIFNQKRHAEMYGSEAVHRMLALDRSGLICIAFITGSDYTEGIEGVGTVGAMEILHEFSGEGLDGLKKFKSWHDTAQKRTKDPQETKVKRKLKSVVLPSEFPSEEVYEAYLHPVVDESTELFEWGKPDLHSLRLYPLNSTSDTYL
ncbi:Helix-hairpin-helix class 2 (Pol1) motif [Desmophyllum pertusum]|uniref:Helix-hairpin-helix class 2 (Pol1) motif n=1 Tax=Desmophyllum pertusum TaxID=174260 RepID=A0A9X0CYJ4_9CNID|nr:Helix-hairpin-helix class 2 (Pol1) motif [Desmophyllum pertusum]